MSGVGKAPNDGGLVLTLQGLSLIIEKLPKKKLPRLFVKFPEENSQYCVAYFKDETTARWFEDLLMEALDKHMKDNVLEVTE